MKSLEELTKSVIIRANKLLLEGNIGSAAYLYSLAGKNILENKSLVEYAADTLLNKDDIYNAVKMYKMIGLDSNLVRYKIAQYKLIKHLREEFTKEENRKAREKAVFKSHLLY